MKRRIYILVMIVWACVSAYAEVPIRYVHPDGEFGNDGESWGTAMPKLQDAINDLHGYMIRHGLDSGCVYVAAGTYIPTEATESSGGSMLNTSFKIYAGIHVYGGFDPTHPESTPGDRMMVNGKKVKDNWADQSGTGTISGSDIASQWELQHKTILSGNHSTSEVVFDFDTIRGRYNTTFPVSSYHVVWFATNGKFAEGGVTEDLYDHFKPLESPASLDGCVITSGNAITRNTTAREHTAYGGGVYMVGNAKISRCTIEKCNAALRGGGVYCDGGGEISFCYVHTCQAAGVGVVQGYGGGVCIDHGGSIGHSHITSCAARCGGGLMISHVSDEYPTTGIEAIDTISNYNPYSVSCVINNNTANAEGGGIYLAEGGTINHATVTNNNCIGPDVTYYGRRHGRTGGIYVRNCGMIFNSVFWGNTCAANNDIQFASVRQKTAINFETFVYHSAFMNHDITDWTGVKKEVVISLDKSNVPIKDKKGNYPCFFAPTAYTGVLYKSAPENYPGPRIWHISSYSVLNRKGVQVTESMTGVSYWLRHAHSSYGVVSNPYDPVSTLGALVRRVDPMRHAMIAQQGQEGRISSTPIPTLFIDPSTAGQFDEHDKFIEPDYVGNSWDNPIQILGDALIYFRTHMVEKPNNAIGSRAYYRLPSAWDEDGNPTDSANYDYVQILVKEGQLSTAGNGNYLGKEARTASIRVMSHMRLYGSYPAGLEGTSTAGRDPYAYITRITANILSLTGEGFNLDNNTAHVVTFGNAEYAIVDGFKLADGNAHKLKKTEAVMAGGGVLVANRNVTQANRIDMVGNELRNSIISNCTAPRGAAVYVDGEFKKGTMPIFMKLCYAELKMTNCVVRNNTADSAAGVVVANGRAFLEVNHCDIVNNVGYPLKSESYGTTTDASLDPYHGYVRVDNSLIFCNGDTLLDHRNSLDTLNVLSIPDDESQNYVYGTYTMFDADIAVHKTDATKPYGFFKSEYTIPNTYGVLPDGYSHPEDHLLRQAVPSAAADRYNQAIFTRSNPGATTYPTFINPVRNVGHSDGGDKALYGGRVYLRPTNANPCVNAASTTLYGGTSIPRTAIEDYEMTDSLRRDYGGHPDIGAIENISLPRKGTAIYVTPNGAGKRDGSSWGNAIAGNTVYMLSNVAGPDLAAGDQLDSEPTCDRVLDSEGNPILTTNSKYNGGWGRVWIESKKETVTTTATTLSQLTVRNIYTGGPDDRDVTDDPIEDRSSVTTEVSSGDAPGFVAGYHYDPRFPYGEISGASRTFWRANPYTGNSGSYNINTFISGCNENGWINNTRAERYVSGLQYAVEKASAANKTNHNDSVQVWVGAGHYTDYKGFIMRDSVTVYGGFPTGKYAAPGQEERQALMSAVIDIPKSLPAKDLEAVDYESVLQISDVNPDSTHLFRQSAVKYWDDNFTAEDISDTETVDTATIFRTNTYTWSTSTPDVSATYIRFSDMLYNSKNVFTERHRRNKAGDDLEKAKDKFFVADNEVFKGITWILGQKVVWQTFGLPWKDANNNESWELTYEDRDYNVNYRTGWSFTENRDVLNESGTTIGTVPRGSQFEGVMNTMSMGQTMKNVPAGNYQLKIDLGAYYTKYVDETNTGITFYILASNGDTLAQQPVYCKGNKLRRYEFSFTQPSTGDLTLRIMSVPGSKATDPSGTGAFTAGSNNYRRVLVANPHLLQVLGEDYVLTSSVDDEDISGTSDPQARMLYNYTATTHRTTLRKRVLTMPDVCVPTYGGGGIGDPVSMATSFGDNLAHTDRVKGDSKDKRTASTYTKYEDPAYVEYNEANWDGFTIRHGFIYDESMAHGGGAGVNVYEGAHLRNCIVVNNLAGSRNMKGGGIFCDGATSTIEGCFVLNNTTTYGTNSEMQKQRFAGGMFMYEGTCFNSLFANNYSNGSAGGVGFCVGRFFNNTIAYNTCDLEEGGHKNGGAISIATSSNPNLFVANTIIYGNNGMAIRERYDADIKMNQINPFINCYVQNEVAFTQDLYKKNIGNHSDNAANYGENNILLDGVEPSKYNTPFAADFVEGVYTPGNASATNDFRLLNHPKADSSCVNHGTEDLSGVFYTALENKGVKNIEDLFIYQSVLEAKIPSNDVAFADRVQDCQIDIGAYEYDASHSIRPDTTTHPGRAIFYVTLEPTGGDASASSPANAACKQKIQHILDAAGRYKYALMTASRYNKGTAGTYVADQPNKHWSVEVWLDGNAAGITLFDEPTDYYTPTRSTKHSVPNYNDNPIDYSFIIPHGIKVIGGWEEWFFHYEDADGKWGPEDGKGNMIRRYTAEDPGVHLVDDSDPLNNRTVLFGDIVSSTGAEGRTYHVVTFTNDLFDTDGKVMEDGGQLAFLSTLSDAEAQRVVVQNLFIERGEANSPDTEDRIGAGAVVPNYAHVQNCVIIHNEALGNGGGLYLKPGALVSGCIIRDNSADIGGGIYVEAHPTHDVDSLAHIYSTTICANTAASSAGGMWFANTDVRVNSSVLWQNSANDNANVAGNFSRSSEDTDYPFNFCGVESRRLEGQANIELSPRETEGVRWDHQDPYADLNYYPIEMSSTLSRAGMTYSAWAAERIKYPTLDTMDIAGVCRAAWDYKGVQRLFWWNDTLTIKHNDFIEMGARALNKDFEIKVDEKYVMRRLYVMHTDLLNSEAARALQDNKLDNDTANMYRQMGSCMLNPFHRLGDAFDYIIAARRANAAKYRNARFEVFVEQGTYYPYHNAYGEQGQVRMNTFLIPEATTVIGGVDSRMEGHNYGQEGYIHPFTNTIIGNGSNVAVRVTTEEGEDADVTTYVLDYAPTDSIRKRDSKHRAMRDNNLNSIIEPWEFERQTILSGNAVAGEDFTHVYHVITCHADSVHCGPQPIKYRSYVPSGDWRKVILTEPIEMTDSAKFDKECDLSILARTVELDGIQITGGYANRLDGQDSIGHSYVTKTYFRGGGIFVDGNWTTFGDEYATVPNMTDPALYNIPIFVGNCIFNNNMAGNGGGIYSNGGIYMYGSFFTQNYSEGPRTALDQKYIPWTAGGCIATNAECDVATTLFANNEARRGLYPITIKGPDSIPDADARQGFGGVLSVAHNARLRSVNNHFVRNKAVGYSSIYNFKPNSMYGDRDSMQIAINCLFWGNEVFNLPTGKLSDLDHVIAPPDASEKAFADKYRGSRAGVFHYDAEAWETYEQLFHEYDSTYAYWVARNDTFNSAVITKLKALRTQGDKMEGMFFCAYRTGYGPQGMKPNRDGYLLTKAEQRAYIDPRMKPVTVGPDANGDIVEKYDTLFSYVYGNNNTIINRVNTATDGPNFKQPSFVAGIDGYMQNADWLLARMNVTTDQGWGHHKQDVVRGIGYYITKYTGKKHFSSIDKAWEFIKDTVGATKADIYPVSGMPIASYSASQPSPPAMYNYLASRYSAYTGVSNPPLPVLDQYYMFYTATHNKEEELGMMNRISKNPKMGQSDVFIDLGIYEYQYVQLDIEGQEIDTMWVATKNRGSTAGNGLTWENPTTDLQYAIDMLMSSHNDHDKYVCFLGDEEQYFTPINILDNRRTFVISSNSLQPLLPDSAEADIDYGVMSLNFLGGYDFDIKDAPRDPEANPTVIMMPDAGDRSQLNQLFVVEDMTRQMLQVNWQGEYVSRDSVVIPITFDGITFINPYSTKDANSEEELGGQLHRKGGAAIYYRWQRRYEKVGGVFAPDMNFALWPDSTLVNGEKVALPKLTLSNCIFMDNGARVANKYELSPAVRIDHGGGSTLVVNSLFHSNAGHPISTRQSIDPGVENNLSEVQNDVIVVNSTFALNGGHLQLESANSEVHNSLIWLDDLANDTITQLEIDTGLTVKKWDKDANKERGGIEGKVTNNAVWGCFTGVGATFNNESLSTENTNLASGPGFVQPFVTASTAEERRSRSFKLNPSVMTMNKADSSLYKSKVYFREYPDPDAGGPVRYWRRSNGFKSFFITSLAQDSDLACKPRVSGAKMERGAFECLATLQRVLYVIPTKSAHLGGDGSSWAQAFGHGQLQNAIDAAAMYTYFKSDEPDINSRKAYVYVKGTGSSTAAIHIQARDGVSVYGSIPSNFNDTAVIIESEFKDSECQRFENYVRSIVPGVASPDNIDPTRISSVHVVGDEFNTGFLIDGFVLNNSLTHNTSTILLDNANTTMRNCIVADTKVTDVPLADIRRGLLYNCLFYGDSASSIVKVGADGRVLNNTIVVNRAGVDAIDDSEGVANSVVNNIALNTTFTAPNTFTPYLSQSTTPYTLPAHLVRSGALTYQLHEHSTNINAGVNSLPATFDSYVADSVICFWRDRDILGNPRRIGGTIDNGAFETWRVEKNTAAEVTALTNPMLDKDLIVAAEDEDRIRAFKNNYGGNRYPHKGSVVYLMDSSAMTMQYETSEDFDDITLMPAYVLLKPGSSFYGNGHNVKLNYVAAEKRLTNQRYAMTAFPFNYNAGNITVTHYDDEKDSINSQLSPFNFTTYQYSGRARSAKDYVYRPTNSPSWLRIDTLNRTATDGYLMDFGANRDTVLRFNAFAPTNGQYIYTEDGNDKTIYLTQYDNRTAGTGSTLDFTTQENMGWNMKGLPWLVSNYRTDTLLAAGNFYRQMYIPHVLYQMNGAGDYVDEGDKIITTRSWDKGATTSMGMAFFVQTATQQAQEEVIFHLPKYGLNEKAARPLLRLLSRKPKAFTAKRSVSPQDGLSSDIITFIPDSTAAKNVTYSYGRDGLKWILNDSSVNMYLMDSKRQSRIALLGAAPTEVDIPLGIYVPQNAGANDFSFGLPEKEAFADYREVWLIDYKLNLQTNLLYNEYTLPLPAGEYNRRFAIRIGGKKKVKTSADEKTYTVFASGGTLFVRETESGDRISVYTASGQLVATDVANGAEWTMPLPMQTGYIVRINDSAYKVMNR